MNVYFVWLRTTDEVQYPKCAYVLYCQLNLIENGVNIEDEVSLYIHG